MADIANSAIKAAKDKFVDYALPLILGTVIIVVITAIVAKK